MKTVLVTGGAGFIGSHLSDCLISLAMSRRHTQTLQKLSNCSALNLRHQYRMAYRLS